ncbi:OmpA family protein [Siccirubricoccus sp. G192]|uniref:OmpA family protein n=1 Tax=Siccirubricoccus sp. G192 TaxID=2849651 RepID=UPI001C2CB56F|nr:OmpA family protein [Siccirubricoccus sp. G192]MBV1798176.1 OmpA family protein [Siccirubricoccus sp. G192]
MHRRLALAAPLLLGLAACQAPAARTDLARQPVQVVFFTEDSAALGADARTVVADAAQLAKANPNAPVAVLGFAGPSGSQSFNQALSDARARNVADALVAGGVAPGRIQIRPRGPVPFEMMPTESRRVEIRVGG